MRRFYLVTRDLHLYVGLFLSPFVLVFALSVFYLVHGLAQRPVPDQSTSARRVNDLVVPPGLAGMQGRARVEALRSVLDQAGVSGEVDFVRHLPNEHRLIVPAIPGFRLRDFGSARTNRDGRLDFWRSLRIDVAASARAHGVR